ncbi:hypothetical protein MPLA_1530029 [Mesorhizobium sp. ORS 3359]|nr:hypothetical protein MPLA_1530029 [Mesorhizobium sp. ORS 3359]
MPELGLSAVVISFVISTLSPPHPFKQGSKALGKLAVNSKKGPRAQVPSQNLAGKLLSQQLGERFVVTSILGHFHAVLITAKPEATGLVPLRNRDLSSPLAVARERVVARQAQLSSGRPEHKRRSPVWSAAASPKPAAIGFQSSRSKPARSSSGRASPFERLVQHRRDRHGRQDNARPAATHHRGARQHQERRQGFQRQGRAEAA